MIGNPYTRKYLHVEDTCAQCITDWKNGKRHIDLWLDSTTENGHQKVIDCENTPTPDDEQPIARNPLKTNKADTKLISCIKGWDISADF